MKNSTSGVKIQSIDELEWSSIATRFSDYNYEQSLSYADSKAKQTGGLIRFYSVVEDDRILGAACVRIKSIPLLRIGLAYISGGPLIQMGSEARESDCHKTVLGALKQELVDKEGHFLFVRPPLISPPSTNADKMFASLGFHVTQRVRSYHTILLDITPDPQTLRARLAGKWRTDLNFAIKTGLTVECGSDSSIRARFLRLFEEMYKAKSFDLHVDPRFFMGLSGESTGLVILIAKKDGRDAAGQVLSMLGNTAVYLFGATNDLGRRNKAGYLLNWESIVLAKEQGFAWYDLGGIDPDSNPGGYRFKNRMGGQELTAIGPYEAVAENAVASFADILLSLRDLLKTT